MNKKQKELVKIYIVLFILIFIIINWDTVSWVFNYREISGLVYDFFNPYQDSAILVSADNTTATPAVNPVPTPTINNAQPVAVQPVIQPAPQPQPTKIYPYSDKTNSLEIPKINIVTALVVGKSTDIPTLEKDLDKGVVYYPGSVLPTQVGQIIILGHSAPPNWPHIKHDWVFSDLNSLSNGDQIILYFNNVQYTYKVINKAIIDRGQEIPTGGLDKTTNILTLVSCWPPGKDYKRITVQAELAQ